MTAFSDKNFKASDYSTFRPQYQDKWFLDIIQYHCLIEENKKSFEDKTSKVLDIGCGPGEATIPLIKYFNDITSIDLSKVMIDQLNENMEKYQINNPNLKFQGYVSRSEDISKFINDNSIDLVTAAECVHWFDIEPWFEEMSRVLKDNGTLAYWCYLDPIFIGNSKANEIYHEMAYGDEYLGKYWQKEARGKIRNLLRESHEISQDEFKDKFKDFEIDYYNPPKFPKQIKFNLNKKCKLIDFINYAKTWSSGHNWIKDHSDISEDSDEYIFNIFLKKFKDELHWDKDTDIELSWNCSYCLSRRIPRS